MRAAIPVLALLTSCSSAPPATSPPPATLATPPAPTLNAAELLAESGASWRILPSEPFRGKQDDIVFADERRGWYGNGKGFIYGTTDGGDSWNQLIHQDGTFVRALAHAGGDVLFAGNVGPDYFPGVSDPTPLYTSVDGGQSFSAVDAVTPEMIKGICAIDVLKTKFINHGKLENRTTIRAAGRVGGPAKMVTSRDGGKTWKASDLSSVAGSILDVKFIDELTGFLCASSDANIEVSHARILKTRDGGDTWNIVYESTRPFETTWKCDFPTKDIGYASIQSYDPKASARFVAKTVDGGDTWVELPLVDEQSVREFGIGFVDAETGWVGAVDGLWQTTDGGTSWTHLKVGRAINKIRVLHSESGFVAHAIGVEVLRLVAKRADSNKGDDDSNESTPTAALQ